MMNHRLLLLLLLCFTPFVSSNASAKETQAKDPAGRDYWLYTPDIIDPDKTYTLVLGVHGYRGKGKGAGGMAGWAQQHDVIVLGPTYDSDGYQYLDKGSDVQTLDLVKVLRKEFKLQDKIFVAGFSGGSQYAHRFAMKYPNLVAGCAAHSGGTWATGDYAKRAAPNPKARGVLFVISCGENDTKKSFGDAPMGRLEWAKKYETLLNKGGFVYDAQWWPGVGHQQSKGSKQMTLDCFVASTQFLPAFDAERQAIEKAMRGRDYAAAWTLIRARRSDGASEKQGIIAKVQGLYLDSLSPEIEKIDRMAEREVRKAVREHTDPKARREALEAMKGDYGGAAKTIEAIDKALAELG